MGPDAPAAVLAVLGVRRDPCGGALLVPSETTIRRALSDTDAGALDEQPAAWLAAATVPEADEVAAARVMVDGKTMRGAVQADGRAVHLLAAMSGGGAVLAQRQVGHKTNEITQVKPLLDPLPLDGAVVTLDALHAQRETARYLVEDKHADYMPNASPSGRVPIDAPLRCPRNRWQALRNRLDHASYADWPRLCWQAATGHPCRLPVRP